MPRPLLLTDDVATKIVNAIQLGTPRKHAVKAAGIDQTTFNRWLVKAADGEEPFAEFAARVEEAESAAIGRAARQVVAQGRDDWRANAWFLSRRDPENFGDKIQVRIEDGLNAFLNTAERVLEPAQYARLCKALASETGEATSSSAESQGPSGSTDSGNADASGD